MGQGLLFIVKIAFSLYHGWGLQHNLEIWNADIGGVGLVIWRQLMGKDSWRKLVNGCLSCFNVVDILCLSAMLQKAAGWRARLLANVHKYDLNDQIYDQIWQTEGISGILIFSTAIRQSNPAPLSTQSARSPWTKGGTTGHEGRRSRRSRRSYKCFSLDCMATHGYALLYSKTIISKFGACWFHIDFSHISLPAATQPMPKKGTGTNSNSSGHWKPIPKPFKIKSVADQSFQHLDFQFFLLFPHLLADASSFLSGKHGLFQQVPGTASWLWNMWRCLGYPPVNIQKTMENHHF